MQVQIYLIIFSISAALGQPLFGKFGLGRFGNHTGSLIFPQFQNSSINNISAALSLPTILSTTLVNTETLTQSTDLPYSSSSSDISEGTLSAETATSSHVASRSISRTSTTSSTASGTVNTGRGTWYEVGNDNCGTSSTNEDLVCAISQSLYNSNANSESVSDYCGKTITVTYQGKSVTVKVVDSCESCSEEDLDFSPTAFEKLASLDTGEIEIQWSWD